MHKSNKVNQVNDPTTVCSEDISKGVFVATFISSDECNKYTNSPVFGGPSAYSYSNCSVSSYCMTFDNPFAGSLKGFELAGISAKGIYSGNIVFQTAEECSKALNGAFYGVTTHCNDSSLIVDHYSGTGEFVIPLGEVLEFALLPN